MGIRGRLAPSPTGFIHIGNAWAFLLAWLSVRSEHGTVVLRMEDIDPDRSRLEYEEGIVDDLKWLGLDWDEGPDCGGAYGPYRQSERFAIYESSIARLDSESKVYPCFCTRKELKSLASAPHAADYGPMYPGTCGGLSLCERKGLIKQGRRASLRMRSGDSRITFDDAIYGAQSFSPEEWGGDFAIRRSDGVFAYQLAVVVDDAAMNINQVVRGEDILHCTPRQLIIYAALGEHPPQYAHVPLVVDAEGERLAKRHRHYELRMLRERGVKAEALIGYLGWCAGLQPSCKPKAAYDFVAGFSFDKLPTHNIVLESDVIESLIRNS